MLLTHEGVPKNFFLEIHHKKFLIYRPLNKNPPALFSFNMRLGHNFWLGSPIGTRSTRLSAILQDFFRDIPFDLIWRAQICAQNPYLAYLAVFACVIEHAKYGHVGCPWKDLARCSSDALTIVWMGLPSQKLWPNLIFGRFAHCNYNVKVLAFFVSWSKNLKLVWCICTPFGISGQKIREKKSFFWNSLLHICIFLFASFEFWKQQDDNKTVFVFALMKDKKENFLQKNANILIWSNSCSNTACSRTKCLQSMQF